MYLDSICVQITEQITSFLPISLFISSTNYPNCIPMQPYTLPTEDQSVTRFSKTKNAFYNFKSN